MGVYGIDFDMMLAQLRSNLEVDSGDTYHTATDLKRYINLALIEMAKRTKVVQGVRFMHLSASVARYTLLSANILTGQIDQVLYLKDGNLSGAQYALKKLDRRGFQAVTAASNSGFLSSVAYQKPGSGAPLFYLLDMSVIEFRPIPTTAYAGSDRICLKGPGIPNQLSALSAVPGIPPEHRMVPVLYATHLGQIKDKDPRAANTLLQFYSECEEIGADIKWADQEDPPVMLPESAFHSRAGRII